MSLIPRDALSEAMYVSAKRGVPPSSGTQTARKPQATAETASETGGVPSISETHETAAATTQTQNAAETAGRKPWRLRTVLAGAHDGWVRSLAVDPVSNAWFASGSADAQIKIWDLASGAVKATISGHIMGVRALAVSPRHPYLFSGAEDKTLRCWDLERTHSAAGCQVRDYHGHVGGVYAVALHPELDLLFSGGRDSAIRAWDIRSRTQVMVLTGHRSDVTSLVAQAGDPQLCSASMDSTVRLWDLRMQRTHVALTHHTKSVRSLVMHPHEMTMTSGDSSGSLKQWLLPRGQLLNEFGERDGDANIINTLSINPASHELFAGFADGRMHFYDYESGALCQKTQTQSAPGTPLSTIYTSAFDMSGMRLVTGENDKSIKIWGA